MKRCRGRNHSILALKSVWPTSTKTLSKRAGYDCGRAETKPGLWVGRTIETGTVLRRKLCGRAAPWGQRQDGAQGPFVSKCLGNEPPQTNFLPLMAYS